MKETNKIYEILSGNVEIMSNTLVLYNTKTKKTIENTSKYALENGLDFITINDNMMKIHRLLVGSKYEELLKKNPCIYNRDYQKTADVIDRLCDSDYPELVDDALISGNYSTIMSNIDALDKVGDVVLAKINGTATTLNYIIDMYCPSVYVKGKDIESTVEFLDSVDLLHILAKAPSILTNKTETIKDIYKFLKDENRLGIIEENPIVLSAISCNRVRDMYQYGKNNDCLDNCTTMLTYKEDNVLTNDKLFKEYGINKRVSVSILKNNPNKVADMLDDFIEKDAYSGLRKRRTILNMSYEKVEERTSILKVNHQPIQTKRTGRLNPKIFATSNDWDKYKLEGRKEGFGTELTVRPIDIEQSNVLKKRYVSELLLDDYINNTDIRNMELTDDVIDTVKKYMSLLDLFYSVKNADGTVSPLVYNVNGLIISKNKVKRNLTKLFYNDNELVHYGQDAIIASMFGRSRYTENEIENIVNSVRSISLEQTDSKRAKQK